MTSKEYLKKINPEIREYYKIISPVFPEFIMPFIETPVLRRLAGVGYFCGMDYASKEVYDLKYYISRLDHSISTALITWNLTYSEIDTLRALFHDAGTPAFSHVIDYMNDDFVKQESTEANLLDMLKNDDRLMHLFNLLGIKPEEVADFKSSSIVDLDRPRLCADRLDSIFLSNLVWTRKTNLTQIRRIYEDVMVSKNSEGKDEIGFITPEIADEAVELEETLNGFTHREEDFLSMTYLAALTKRLIDLNIITYESLYEYNDQEIIDFIKLLARVDEQEKELYDKFISLKPNEKQCQKEIKNKIIKPLVNGERIS